MTEAERKLAAILSADVVAYSRLMAEDEAATIRTLTDYRAEIALLIEQHRGRVVDAPGDNVLAEFPTALDAVRCAVEIQGVLRTRNASLPTERRMDFRMICSGVWRFWPIPFPLSPRSYPNALTFELDRSEGARSVDRRAGAIREIAVSPGARWGRR